MTTSPSESKREELLEEFLRGDDVKRDARSIRALENTYRE